MNQVWLPVDGALLKKLREEAGVEITTLARKHALSNAQVKQLEDGGDSSFYTPSIKLATGRKLLMHFGADIEREEASTLAQNIFEVLEPEPEPEPATKEVETKQTAVLDLVKANISLRLPILGVLMVLASLIYWDFFLISHGGEKPPLNASKQATTSSPIAAMATESKTIGFTPSIPADTPKETATECQWSGQPAPIFVYRPIKPGDYVHVVANTNGAICFRDATSKIQVVQLRNSQSQTIRGRPPFEVFSHNLNEFKLFYQGNLLKLPSSNTKNIALKEQKYD
jgi:hypothetical protein